MMLVLYGSQSFPPAFTRAFPQNLGHRIVGNGIHQSNFQRPPRGNFFRGHKKFQRSSLPNQPRQALRASPSRHETKSGTAMSERRVRRSNSSVTGQREIKTSSHAGAFNRGDDRSRVAGDGIHERLSHGGKLVGLCAGQGSNFIQVGPHRKKSAIACDDQRNLLPLPFVPYFTDGGAKRHHESASEAIRAVRRI